MKIQKLGTYTTSTQKGPQKMVTSRYQHHQLFWRCIYGGRSLIGLGTNDIWIRLVGAVCYDVLNIIYHLC